jgi:chromosome segregation ATPase
VQEDIKMEQREIERDRGEVISGLRQQVQDLDAEIARIDFEKDETKTRIGQSIDKLKDALNQRKNQLEKHIEYLEHMPMGAYHEQGDSLRGYYEMERVKYEQLLDSMGDNAP